MRRIEDETYNGRLDEVEEDIEKKKNGRVRIKIEEE